MNCLLGRGSIFLTLGSAHRGGVDDAWEGNNNEAETVEEASQRELWEEMGLKNKKDVLLIPDQGSLIKPVRYETRGTNNWLTNNGFSGQELHWMIFRCIDGRGDSNASLVCDLSGSNGEEPEFSSVEWRSIDLVVANMWPAKRGPYEKLQQSFAVIVKNWQEQTCHAGFSGTWSRDASLNENVVEALIKRGLSAETAKAEAGKQYVQKWSPTASDTLETTWNVKTFDGDSNKVRRDLDYQVGSWKESFTGNAVLFGNVRDGLNRTTSYLPEPTADTKVSFVTITTAPDREGIEESRRYIKDGKLVLQRTFWPSHDSVGTVSKEVFERLPDFD